MLKKVRNLRAIRPGQWARTKVPAYECWQQKGDWREVGVGDEVDICVMPIYQPRFEHEYAFEWRYHVAYRRPGTTWHNFHRPNGGFISSWDFGLLEGTNKPFWNEQEFHEFLDGKGAFLYEPASDDPELCPGPDCSLYLCDTCGEYRMPWSDDDGNLLCSMCEVTGLVIEPSQVERLEQIREFARQMGLSEQLAKQLTFLDSRECWGKRSQCVLSWDFAPHSFTFAHYVLPDATKSGKREFYMNGGLIYSGPGSPGDGSFPALSVNLHEGVGWFCHT
jgi:hypothetical protein